MKKNMLGLVTLVSTLMVTSSVFAQDSMGSNPKSWGFFGAAIAIAVAVLGGALGQSRAAAAALDGIARNPGAQEKIQTPLILSLALIESLVLFGFAIAYLILEAAKAS
jgi:F-type H+-transporting ATPase subunit c